MKRYEQVKLDFRNALLALEAATSQAHNDLEIDGAIQRFEFTYELFWKLLKTYLKGQGVLADTPRACFKEAFQARLLEDEEAALKMVDDRNLTVHIYDQKTSREVFDRIRTSHILVFERTLEQIERKSV